jgi:hypothetical protein
VDTGAFTPEGTFADWRAAAVAVETVGEEDQRLMPAPG